MNILLITSHLNVGGITSYLFGLTRQYQKKGHVVFIASAGGARENEFRQLGAELFIAPLKVKSEVHPNLFFHLPRLSKFIKANKIDIIHSHTRVTQVLGQMASWMTGVPYVATCHGFYKTRWFRKMFPCWGQAVVAISPPVREHLIKDFNVRPENTFLIQNGVDVDAFQCVNDDLRRQTRQKFRIEQSPIIGIVARLADVKGHDVLIDAMPEILKKYPNALLFIAGEGKMEAQLKEQVERLGIKNHVNFAAVFNPSGQVLSLLDVLAMPSLDEGFGLSGMEAQAAGLPVVASNVGGIPSFITDGVTGLLVPPKNPALLARAILIVLDDKDLAKRLGAEARTFIQKNFSSVITAEKTLAMYHQVFKRP